MQITPYYPLLTKLEGKFIARVKLRTVILLSPVMILVGFLLAYVASFTSILRDELGFGPVSVAQTAAFGVTLILMGIVAPIVRLWQERSRRMKRAQKALQRKKSEAS